MANQMNVIAVEGFLTCDVSLSFDEKKKTSIARFYLKNPCKIGQNNYNNDFYIIVYGKKAEECARNLSNGSLCSVTGKVATWLKNDKKGNVQPGITIIASDVHYKENEKDSFEVL